MLPGLRFLFAAIVLSLSIVIFGLGATALLRAAHQEFASTPSWQPAPETRFAQNEPPVLAMLRVEPAAEETKASNSVVEVAAASDQSIAEQAPAIPPVASPIAESQSATSQPAANQPTATPPTESRGDIAATVAAPTVTTPASAPTLAVADKSTTLQPEDSPAPETTSAISAQKPVSAEAIPSPREAVLESLPASASADEITITSTANVASTATKPARMGATRKITFESTNPLASPQAARSAMSVAALDDASTSIGPKPASNVAKASAAKAKPDRKSNVKRRQEARTIVRHRRVAARARLARQSAAAAADPFALNSVTPAQ